jgi:hypothetical protein
MSRVCSRHASSRRASVPGAATFAAIITVLAACQESPFAHTNPSDALSGFTATLEGVPDTLRGYGAQFTASLVTEPVVPSEFMRRYLTTNEVDLPPVRLDGTFRGARRSASPVTVTVIARVGSYVDQRQVVVYSDVASLSFSCASTGCGPIVSIGDALDIGLQAFVQGPIPMGGLMYAFNNNRGEIVVRDTIVLEGVGLFGESLYRVRARRNGESWVVFQADAALDSVLVTVSQVVDRWDTISCPAETTVGEVVTFIGTDPVDRGGTPVEGIPDLVWMPTFPDLWTGDAIVESDGRVTALAAGWVQVASVRPAPYPGNFIRVCNLTILP